MTEGPATAAVLRGISEMGGCDRRVKPLCDCSECMQSMSQTNVLAIGYGTNHKPWFVQWSKLLEGPHADGVSRSFWMRCWLCNEGLDTAGSTWTRPEYEVNVGGMRPHVRHMREKTALLIRWKCPNGCDGEEPGRAWYHSKLPLSLWMEV